YGLRGSEGEDARNCYQPYNSAYDLRGADGGRGGNGGNGGHGGRGGDVTIFYQNINDLRQFRIYSVGGSGGYSGEGSNGGRGCYCTTRRWSIRECHTETGPNNTPQEICKDNYYSCTDGSNGQNGYRGSQGTTGRYGSLTLIPNIDTLPFEQPSRSLQLSSMLEQTYELSYHNWNYLSGANTFLANGSLVADKYKLYLGTTYRQFKLVWNTSRAISDFQNTNITISTSSSQNGISIYFPQNIWLNGNYSYNGNSTSYQINNIFREEEAKSVVISKGGGSRANMYLQLVDNNGLTNLVNTKFYLKLKRYHGISHGYNKWVPANLVVLNNNTYTIMLGKLGMLSFYTKPGRQFEVELEIVRTMNDKSVTYWTNKFVFTAN
ncbi:MAG: hypothetical protein HQK51_19075, partial [Oligoflexia bacterium]|nr:hypothetical protein [Oligoflexia bacterium]